MGRCMLCITYELITTVQVCNIEFDIGVISSNLSYLNTIAAECTKVPCPAILIDSFLYSNFYFLLEFH